MEGMKFIQKLKYSWQKVSAQIIYEKRNFRGTRKVGSDAVNGTGQTKAELP